METIFDGIELYLYIKELKDFGLTDIEIEQIIYDLFVSDEVAYIH